ncbi:hypothetical protein HDK77DRAFT_185495 [Phyllosticta capitalensis]|uniref:uncharacterized protein n=1 Tax=Phyllosticta capitalensis TaxID=121624 RepID=UPI00312DD048
MSPCFLWRGFCMTLMSTLARRRLFPPQQEVRCKSKAISLLHKHRRPDLNLAAHSGNSSGGRLQACKPASKHQASHRGLLAICRCAPTAPALTDFAHQTPNWVSRPITATTSLPFAHAALALAPAT